METTQTHPAARAPLAPNIDVLSRLPPNYGGFSIEDGTFIALQTKAEKEHFWFTARNRFIAHRLTRSGVKPPAELLELGCGAGCVSAHLAGLGFNVTGVDGHLPLIDTAAQRAPSARFFVHDLAQGIAPLLDRSWDATGLFDVLEHLEAPEAVLRDAARLTRPGGLVVGTVPALQSLWSEVDEYTGHQRRYDAGSLERLLRSIHDLELCELRYFNRLLVPVMWVARGRKQSRDAMYRELRTPFGPLNASLEWALRLEYLFGPALDWLRLPGASLWFAARKR